MRGQRRRRVETSADDQAEHSEQFGVGGGFAVDPQSCQRVHDAGARVLADLEQVVEQVRAHRHRLLQNPWGVWGIGGRVDVGVGRLAIELPLLQRNAHQGQRQDGRHDVREIVDEVDPPGFDLLVDAGPHDLVDEWLPAFDGRRRQVGVEDAAVGGVLGFIHLEHAATHAGGLRNRGNGDALVAGAFAGDVVVVGHVRASRELEPPGCPPPPNARRRCRSTPPGTWRASPR